MDIGEWLRGLGLQQYVTAFRENDVEAEVLPRLTAEDLKDIGVSSVGHRRKLLEAIAELRDRSSPTSAEGVNETAQVTELASAAVSPTGAERRQLTVMFVDLVGSTALSARLDPEEMRDVIRAYQDACAGEIAPLRGPRRQIHGRRRAGLFRLAQAHEDDAERAVRAGLAVVDAVGAAAHAAGRAARGAGRHRDRARRGRRARRRGSGAGAGGGRRDAEPGRAAAGAGRAGQRW